MNETQAWDAKYGTEASEIARRKDELSYGFLSGTLHEVLRFEKEHAEVLEVGCGTGQHSVALALARPLWRVTATDTSQNAVDETRALARSAAAPGVESRVADATALPFSDGSFDVVFGDHVLGHIPDAGRAVSECLRVLRKGGIAVFNGGNALRPDGWPLHHALSKKTYYKRSFFPYQLVGLFTGRGGTLLRSYGTLVFLDRGWRLLLPRKPKTDSGARTPAPPGLRKGLKRKIKAVLDRALPVWLKVEYGIVVTKA